MTPIERVLAALPTAKSAGDRKWKACCRAHEDKNPSLSIWLDNQSNVGVKCHSGCTTEEIATSLGIEVRDLFADSERREREPDRKPSKAFAKAADAVAALEAQHGKRSATWIYANAQGEPVGVIVRWDHAHGKTIRPVSRTPGGWIHGGMPTPRLLYRLPDLLAEPESMVFVVEGEKCCEAMRSIGMLATTSPHGSNSFRQADWSTLAGRTVVILPDADKAGVGYAFGVRKELESLQPPAKVKVVELHGLAEGGDIADFIAMRNEDGKDANEIRLEVEAIARTAPATPATPTASTATPIATGPRVTTLTDAARSYLESIRHGQTPLVGTGIDDLDYALGGGVEFGELVIVAARPSHGKSAVGLQMVHAWTASGIPCAFLSEEMSALALGKRTLQFVSTVQQEHWSDAAERVEAEIADYAASHAKCVVVESVGTAAKAVEALETAIARDGVRAVVVDYAQLLRGEGRNDYERLSAVSVQLRQLASKHKILVVALCQLNREIEGRPSFTPTMADLRGSGQFEQDADCIIFAVWPWRVDQEQPQARYQFYVAKNRNRAINQRVVDCSFDPARQTVGMARIACPFAKREL